MEDKDKMFFCLHCMSQHVGTHCPFSMARRTTPKVGDLVCTAAGWFGVLVEIGRRYYAVYAPNHVYADKTGIVICQTDNIADEMWTVSSLENAL